MRRIAMLLALLDGVNTVSLAHLKAADSLWSFAADTWRMVFHDGVERSPYAERLLEDLEQGGAVGLSRSAIRDEVIRCNNVPAEVIEAALRELESAGLAFMRRESTSGRSIQRW